MNKFHIDCRTGQVSVKQKQQFTRAQIVSRVKHVHSRLIVVNQITDDELNDLASKILSGTRNINYLTNVDNRRRLMAVATYIVREFSY
jgi:hypothetical protein